MTRIALLKIRDGGVSQKFNVSLQIFKFTSTLPREIPGNLPHNPDIEGLYVCWQTNFRNLSESYTNNRNSQQDNYDDWQIQSTLATNYSTSEGIEACQNFIESLENSIKEWLNPVPNISKDLSRIREQLAVELNNKSEQFQIIIQPEDVLLYKLNWYVWDLLENNLDVGISFNLLQYHQEELNQVKPRQKNKVRILAVFGDSRNINLEPDWKEINKLKEKGAEVVPLYKPTAKKFIEALVDEQGWDILFFAGHSNQKNETGIIYINEQETLKVQQFKNALKEARQYGLQIGIFNSCKGLGLATELSNLQIPFTIVMQDVVPDIVAQSFLKEFLTEYAGGKALPKALRLAQSRLEKFTELPGATWLPVMFQSYIGIAPTWQDFLLPKPEDYVESENKLPWYQYKYIPLAPPPTPKKPKLRVVFLISLIVTIFLTGVRSLGLLEPSELLAYDHLISQRPSELIDERILVVEITNDDVSEYGYPIKQDAILAQLISELEKYSPRIIGLDLHRYQVRQPGREDFIQHFLENKNIFTVCSFGSYNDINYLPPQELIKNNLNSQIGFSDLVVDSKKHKNTRADLIVKQPDDENIVIRRQLLSYEPSLLSSPSNCSTPYSFSFRIAFRFLYQEGIKGIINKNEEFQFKSVILKKLPSHFGGYQNLDGQINQIMINYRSQTPGQRVRLKKVLQGDIDPLLVKNKIVLIGYTADSARDNFNTPLTRKMPGVWIHAHQVSQIISAVMEERPLIWVLPKWREFQWGDILWILVWSILGGLLAWILSKSPLYLGLSIICMIWILYRICLFSINQGLWLPLIPSLLSLLVTPVILTKLKSVNSNQQLSFNQENK
ncbi:CHASE2 domain-containing protein [Nodularia sp. UHCC 0506]|uniref:CHASE2 domain-containing protein n=1 Tax=Nodularia sp. UHCC 0506 TaxID=3110243 RepID=UPI002B1F2E45|nr:CHASE2 domain-containing protein [Nodularia sp. UHCC 0506]MEA5516755.1 CHASE2 domain-containing protein [Nodularia sp. UHCC 0506]